jgi:hypothetical protein
MTALAIIEEANNAGVRLSLNGDKLTMKASTKPPDDLLAKVREHKLSIVAILKQEAAGIEPGDAQNSAKRAENSAHSTRDLAVANATELVGSGLSHRNAAKLLGVGHGTISRDLTDPNGSRPDPNASPKSIMPAGMFETIGLNNAHEWGTNLPPDEALRLAQARAEVRAEAARAVSQSTPQVMTPGGAPAAWHPMPHPRITREPPFGSDGEPPARYRAAWAAVLAKSPDGIKGAAWEQAMYDTARLFGDFGIELERLAWKPDDLFVLPHGLVWFIHGNYCAAIGATMAQMADGRIWRTAP